LSLDNLAIILGSVCGVIFLVIVVVCFGVFLAKRKKARNTEEGVGIPMSTITTSTSQPRANPYPPASDSTSPVVSSSSNPNPEESTPPFPGEKDVPQYPPPGELYPWQQSSNSA